MAAKQSERIKLWGIVQGVGFRPYVAKTAAALQMKGNVLNIGGLVEITVTDTAERISAFLHTLIENKPAPSEIVHIKREPIEYQDFDAFTIIKSAGGDDEAAMIPADLAICPSCLKELYDEHNPRYQHPFISCMVCGPRYTIIDKIPYDRENTSMIDFPMCDFCNGEYTDLSDRRYHAQTISCHDCGPALLWKDAPARPAASFMEQSKTASDIADNVSQNGGGPRQFAVSSMKQAKISPTPNKTSDGTETENGVVSDTAQNNSQLTDPAQGDAQFTNTAQGDTRLTDPAILDAAANTLKNEGVILFKSVGGYNLVADPRSKKAVAALRQIKNREEKPFAVMFKDLSQIRQFCFVNAVEEKLLASSARPILLLEHRFDTGGSPNAGHATTNIANDRCNATTADANRTDDNRNIENANCADDNNGNIANANCTDDPGFTELNKSRFIGSFLPSFAAQYLLLDRISPLIFTSANLSDMPMIKDDDEAFALFGRTPQINGVLYNERKIRIRADDSVARVIDGQPQMIRRSKGYAPVPLYVNIRSVQENGRSEALPARMHCPPGYTARPGTDDNGKTSEKTQTTQTPQIFATGSQLKNSFALTKDNFVYMSQFFGDMDTLENQQIYEENMRRLKSLFRITPQAVICDMHPLYFTTQFAEKYAAENDLPLMKVQHHHAHVASVMAENDLQGKVIGVSFDGTGYGTDGNIWGGEFFLCEGAEAQRIAHLQYVDMIGGDSSVKDATRSALSYIYAHENNYLADGQKNSESRFTRQNENPVNSKHAANANAFLDFDKPSKSSNLAGSKTAVSHIDEESRQVAIDLSDIIAFGKARLLGLPAAKLVMSALDAKINTVKSSSMGRLFDAVSALLQIKDYNGYEGQCAIMLEDAAAFAQKHPGEKENCDLALAFHHKIIDMILAQCQAARKKYHTSQVALTGGTFQNKILMEGALKKLRADAFQPYYNISVSPNDGGIALGQAYIAMHRMKH